MMPAYYAVVTYFGEPVFTSISRDSCVLYIKHHPDCYYEIEEVHDFDSSSLLYS